MSLDWTPRSFVIVRKGFSSKLQFSALQAFESSFKVDKPTAALPIGQSVRH